MAVSALQGYNRAVSAVNKLFGVYSNDIVDVDTGLGYQQNLTPDTAGEFETYIDYDFYVNGTDPIRSFNGTSWSVDGLRNRAPIAKYVKVYGVRLYLGYITIGSSVFPSRVWFTDNPTNNDAVWGLEYGTTLDQTTGSAVVVADGSYFKKAGIKEGDPLFILTGSNTGQYEVQSIDSNNQLTLTKTLDATVSNSTYIVGSNYFDVRTSDNDYIRGFGENSNRLLVFKLLSLHRYNGSSLIQVPGALGTSSHRSIINAVNTYYFHGSEGTKTGVYMYNGTESTKVSTAIQPYIDGIASSIFPSVVGWREGDWVRFYVGDITNSQRNISVTKAVISYNEAINGWSVDPIEKVPKVAATFVESNAQKIFFGDDSAGVYQTPSGYSFDTAPIPFAFETGPQYPLGSEFLLKYTRIQIIARDARGVTVAYKLYNNPKDIDDQWTPIGEIKNDKTELIIPNNHARASGINLRFEETGIRENTPYIEKASIFYLTDNTNYTR